MKRVGKKKEAGVSSMEVRKDRENQQACFDALVRDDAMSRVDG